MTDGRCADCRKGHYDLGNGVIANFPCTREGCTCWFCGPVTSTVQAEARKAVHARLETPCPDDQPFGTVSSHADTT